MKVAIVTGASRGIGACVARGLAEDGFSLALTARSKEGLDQVASSIKQKKYDGVQVLTFPCDVSDSKAINEMVSSVVSKLGRIDLLVNNAGMGKTGTLGITPEEFDEVLTVNLKGPFTLLKSVVPTMKSQGGGTIINVASRAGKIGFAGWGAYAASKFGMVGLGESLYRELSPMGIRVTTLCPSWVDTDMAKVSTFPANQMLSPEDILKSIRYILSLSPAASVKELMIECRSHLA